MLPIGGRQGTASLTLARCLHENLM